MNALLLYFADTYRPVRMRFRTLHPRLGARPALSLCRQWLSAALIGRRPQLEPLTPSQSPVGSAKRRFSTPSDAVTIGAISSRRALTPSGSARRIQCLAALVFPSVRRSCRMQSTSGSCPRGIRKPSVSCSQTWWPEKATSRIVVARSSDTSRWNSHCVAWSVNQRTPLCSS